MLVLEHLSVRYGPITAVRDVSFEIGPGTITALIGNNGAGKSSIVNAISGLQRASGGCVRFAGEDITHRDPADIVRAGISQVPEGRRVFPALTVRENLMMGAYALKNKASVESEVARLTALFPALKERLKQLAGSLSGGEQQMLVLARALMAHPRLLMLDEPSLGLAPKVVAEVFRVIGDIRESGVAILLVEQNAKKALSIADTGVVLQRGEVVRSGAASTLLDDPAVQRAYIG